MPRIDPPSAQSPKDAFLRLIDGVQVLMREHLALARAELRNDLALASRDLAMGAVGLALGGVGYLLALLAIAWALGQVIPLWLALGLVALPNLGLGAWLAARASGSLSSYRLSMHATQAELGRDRDWAEQLPEAGTKDPAPAVNGSAIASPSSRRTHG